MLQSYETNLNLPNNLRQNFTETSRCVTVQEYVGEKETYI